MRYDLAFLLRTKVSQEPGGVPLSGSGVECRGVVQPVQPVLGSRGLSQRRTVGLPVEWLHRPLQPRSRDCLEVEEK